MNDVMFAAPRIANAGYRYPYRLEIEGLRAVAVLSVILFHVGFPFSGGYVGVDVFFVISGFLITRNILKDQESGIFTFGRFYLRRIRRLFPALAATLLLTLAGGFMFLAPDDMARLGQTALFSVASLSNVLFWLEIGYFDAAATLKPLLHTWSLSVEEQFYLFWPAAIVCASRLGRSRAITAMVISIGTASFVSAELFRTAHPGAVFYLVPFRMFELCAGAVLAVIPRQRHSHQLSAQLAMIAGLSAIAYSVIYFDSATSLRHFWSLLPCIGAALVIYAGNTPWSGLLLSNRFMTAVGTISYSLYLVHWPIVAFYKYRSSATISAGDKLLLVLLCLAMATIMYRVVELPFRSGRTDRMPVSTRTAAIACAALALCVSTTGAHAWYSNGWAFRVPAELRSIPSETAM
jgi:peptidoglycan/LPS O-acetylase OafA/YrhL